MKTDKTFHCNIKQAGKVLSEAEFDTFIPLKVWHFLSEGVTNKVFVNIKRKPLMTTDIRIDKEASFELDGVGYVHYLYTDSIHFGYAVEISKKKKVECRSSYINTLSGKNINGFEVKHVLNMNGFSAYKIGGDFLIGNVRNDLINHLL